MTKEFKLLLDPVDVEIAKDLYGGLSISELCRRGLQRLINDVEVPSHNITEKNNKSANMKFSGLLA